MQKKHIRLKTNRVARITNSPYLASYIFSMYLTWGKCVYEREWGSR